MPLWSDILVSFVAIQGLVLAGILCFHPAGHRVANRLLAVIVLVATYFACTDFLYNRGALPGSAVLVVLPVPLAFLVTPSLFLYVRCLLDERAALGARDLAHLAPFVVACVGFLPVLVGGPSARLAYMEKHVLGLRTVHLLCLQGVSAYYLFRARRMLARHGAMAARESPAADGGKLRWLNHLVGTFSVIWFLVFVYVFTEFSARATLLLWLSTCLLIASLGIWALWRSPFLHLRHEPKAAPAPARPARKAETAKYASSGLAASDLASAQARLLEHLERSKCYLNPNLKVTELSRALGVPEYQISQILNVGLRRNFYDLVNGLRIDEAKRRLEDPASRDLTILDIAYETGFNSKSAFNTAFRKHTGMTPSEYRSRLPRAAPPGAPGPGLQADRGAP